MIPAEGQHKDRATSSPAPGCSLHRGCALGTCSSPGLGLQRSDSLGWSSEEHRPPCLWPAPAFLCIQMGARSPCPPPSCPASAAPEPGRSHSSSNGQF